MKTIETRQQLYDQLKSKGNACVQKQDYASALTFYTECIGLDPDEPTAYLNRALCHLKLNRADEAFADSSFVLEKDEANVKALYRRAKAALLRGDTTQARRDISKLLIVEPGNQMARDELGRIEGFEKKEMEPLPVGWSNYFRIPQFTVS